MVDYRAKLDIDFDLSKKQMDILQRNTDTIVRAVPGSGKTTILTLKIKELLIDNPNIRQICCISYTNVNVEDLENSCTRKVDSELLHKVEFLTFHKFCLQYILHPFSYLYRSNSGLRPYKKIFNYREHGLLLTKFLEESGADVLDIKEITDSQSIYYNIKHKAGHWIPISNKLKSNTIIKYWNFLNVNKLIDLNLINLLSLFIIQENKFVKRALNKTIDWMFIDEFQDVNDIQCEIIEELRKSREYVNSEMKWFIVGDPNQSIYGFAGANPRSIYDTKNFFNAMGDEGGNCEIKLDRTYRCSDKTFSFARTNYNNVLLRIKDSASVRDLCDQDMIQYLDDLQISYEICGKDDDSDVHIKNTLSGVSEIVNLKFNELINDEVCCIGITKYNSIDVYKQYKTQVGIDDGEDFSLYSELYRDFEDEYGFKYFSLFISYLMFKYSFYSNRVKFVPAINKYFYWLGQLVSEKIPEENIEGKLLTIMVYSVDLKIPLKITDGILEEFDKFSDRLSTILKETFPMYADIIISFEKKNMKNFENIKIPTIQGFIDFIERTNNDKTIFEIRHIHKIKGLEYDQVIVQKIEDLPHKSNYKIHKAIFLGYEDKLTKEDVYNYIQEINKLYVMLTRAKKNLYIIVDKNRLPALIELNR